MTDIHSENASDSGAPLLEVQPKVVETINAIFTDIFEIEGPRLVATAHLYDDLGLDSIDAIDLLIRFEERFHFRPTDEEMRAIRTMGDVYQLAQKYYHKSQGAI